MKSNIKKSIKYLLLFALAGTLFIFYLLPLSLYAPTFEKAVSFYGEIYLFILFGSFPIWWTFPSGDIIFKTVATIMGIISWGSWVYMIKKNIFSFWKIIIPIFAWVIMGWFVVFADITASI